MLTRHLPAILIGFVGMYIVFFSSGDDVVKHFLLLGAGLFGVYIIHIIDELIYLFFITRMQKRLNEKEK